MHKLARNIIVFILTWEAKRVLKKWKPSVILVSGSVGKTTTKDAIYHVLHPSGSVRKSEKSFNSEIGVPLTILGLPNAWSNPLRWLENIWHGYRVVSTEKSYPKTLVLEVGSDHPGDIAELLKWLHPDISVVTCLPEVPVHVENFQSPEEVRHEDSLVVGALSPHGVYVANLDDPYSSVLIKNAEERNIRTVTYGFGENAMVRGSYLRVRYALSEGSQAPAGMEFRVAVENIEYPVYVNGVLGAHVCMAILAAIAVGYARGESLERVISDIVELETPPGRMRIINGKLGSTIIDDSYNSSPIALEAALVVLRDIAAPRKIALLGDMLELGSFTEEEHWKAGRIAGGFVDELITVGTHARLIAEAGKSAGLPQGCIHHFATSEEAGNFMKSILAKGDVMLIKGSQGSGAHMIRMERAVRLLMAHPNEAAAKLVRQDEEWQAQYKKLA